MLRKQQKKGFTLIEILISIAILVIGLTGIFVLFPIGLKATKKTTETANAITIAESVLSSFNTSIDRLRLEIKKTVSPSDVLNLQLDFFYDGIDMSSAQFTLPFVDNPLTSSVNENDSLFIPGPTSANFCQLGGVTSSSFPYNIPTFGTEDTGHDIFQQYSFNIEIKYPVNTISQIKDQIIDLRDNLTDDNKANLVEELSNIRGNLNNFLKIPGLFGITIPSLPTSEISNVLGGIDALVADLQDDSSVETVGEIRTDINNNILISDLDTAFAALSIGAPELEGLFEVTVRVRRQSKIVYKVSTNFTLE